MECNIVRQDNNVQVSISGKCTFADHDYFQDIIKSTSDEEVKSLSINMAGMEFIDSSGLGMLMMLKDKCNTDIALVSPQGQVEKMLKVAQFDKMFQVSFAS